MSMLNVGTPESPATLLPPRLSLLNDPKLIETRPFLKGFAENMKCAVTSDIVQERYGEMEQFLNEKLGEAMYGKMDGATAVKEAAVEAEDLLK
jgi:multiple sugar transport system substrate-binding protein